MQKCKSCPLNCAFSRSLIRPHISAKTRKKCRYVCLLNSNSVNLNSVKQSFSKNDGFTDSAKQSKTLKPVCAIHARTDLHFALRLNSDPTDFAFSIRRIFVLEVIVRYDPYLQLRCAVRYTAVVVYGELQLFQQNPPSSGMVVLGDGVPAAGRMGAAGVIVLGADRLDT